MNAEMQKQATGLALGLALLAGGLGAYWLSLNSGGEDKPLPTAAITMARGWINPDTDIGNVAVVGSDVFVGYHPARFYQRTNGTLDVLVLARELADKAGQPVQVHAIPVDQIKLVGTATAPEEYCTANASPNAEHSTGTCWDQFNTASTKLARAKARDQKAQQKLLDKVVIVVPVIVTEESE